MGNGKKRKTKTDDVFKKNTDQSDESIEKYTTKRIRSDSTKKRGSSSKKKLKQKADSNKDAKCKEE